MPHLFSVIGSRSSLFLLIQNASLVVKYYQDGKEVAVCDTNLPISENRWYHLVVSHALNRMDRSRSTMSLSLDGVCNFECPYMYPVFESNPQVFIGTRGVDLLYTNVPTVYTELSGEIGTVYLFNKPLSKEQAYGIYLLGSNYMYNFENMAIEHRSVFEQDLVTDKDRATVRMLCDGSLTPSLLVNLSACVQDKEKKAVLDNTPPRYRMTKWGPITKDNKDGFAQAVNGELCAGTYVCSTKQIPLVLDSLGGIALFLPLLTQLDLMASGAEEGDYAMDPEFTEGVYSLLSAAVMTPSSQQYIQEHNVFEILAYLLQRATPAHLTASLFNRIISLLESPKLSRDLHSQLFKALLQNSALWVYCPADLQVRVYDYIREALISKESEEIVSCIKSYGIKGFTDTIRYYYSELELEISEELNEERSYLKQWLVLNGEFIHPLSGEVVASRLPASECERVRSSLFGILNELIRGI